MPLSGKGRSITIPGASLPFRWSRDGKSITAVRTDEVGVSNVWSFPVWGGGAPRRLTNFEEDAILAFAWSPSGERLACIRASNQGADVVLLQRHSGDPPRR
jgi:Tol biopolymer transport system component